jgi:hypothetical protein
MAAGSFALSGVALTFQRGYSMIMSAGSFILTGIAAKLRGPTRWFARDTKNSATMTAETKNSATWTQDIPK